MSKAYLFYVLMFGAAIGGLWVILTLGKAAKAPDDLNGEWTIAWKGTPPEEVRHGPMRISQSGRYFVVKFGQRPGIGLTLQPNWHGTRDGRVLQMTLHGDVWKMYLRGDIPLGERPLVGEMQVVMSGPGDVAGVARRVGYEPSQTGSRTSRRPALRESRPVPGPDNAPTTEPAGVVHAR